MSEPTHPGIARALALLAAPGIGTTTVRRMILGLGGWTALGEAPLERLSALAVTHVRRCALSPTILGELLAEAQRTLDLLSDCDGVALCAEDPRWPRAIDRLQADAPLLLFARGALPVLQRPGLAVVGTRSPSIYGAACARRFGLRVVEHGAVVVSGLALGCDGEAHAGALDGHGLTTAVLPCPINHVAPASHRRLADQILAGGGCLLSEYAPALELRVEKHHFIARDRLQAALAAGVVVVETSATGGTLHAVHAAQRLGLPVACLIRDDLAWREDPNTAGGQSLVAAGEATALRTADDLHAFLGRTLGAPGAPTVPPGTP